MVDDQDERTIAVHPIVKRLYGTQVRVMPFEEWAEGRSVGSGPSGSYTIVPVGALKLS